MASIEQAIAEARDKIIEDGKKNGNLLAPNVGVETPEKVETPPAEEIEAEETVEETTEETPAQEELTEDQIKEAKTLYNALLDPTKRVGIVAALAQQAGLIGSSFPPPETPAEEKKVKKAIVDIFKEALPEFPALAEKLGPAIDKVLEQEREEHQEQLKSVQLTQLENQVSGEIQSLNREMKGALTQPIVNKMAELSSQILMGPEMSLKEYVRVLYTVASAGKQKQTTSAQIADKIRRNATNAPDRLRSTGGSERIASVPNKRMNLNESINWAIEQAQQGRTK